MIFLAISDVSFRCVHIKLVFVHGRSFAPYQVFSASRAFLVYSNVFGNPGNYIKVEQEEHLNGASLGQGPAVSANIKLGLTYKYKA